VKQLYNRYCSNKHTRAVINTHVPRIFGGRSRLPRERESAREREAREGARERGWKI
jgi:phage terminase small subunit